MKKRYREHLGVVVAGFVAGATGGFLMQHGSTDSAPLSVASPAYAAEPVPARAPRLGAAAVSPAAKPAASAALTRKAAVDRSGDRLTSYVREPYDYASLGRRDPFASLIDGEFLADGKAGLVDVGDMKLVGIAWDEIDRFAMVEDGRGFGYVLREGDAIRGGKVFKINRESVTFVQTTAGVASTITIDLPIREVD